MPLRYPSWRRSPVAPSGSCTSATRRRGGRGCRSVRVRRTPDRALAAVRLTRPLRGTPVSVVTAQDGRTWTLLRTRTGGRVGVLARRGRVRLLPLRLPAPVQLVDGIPPAPYLGFASAGEIGGPERRRGANPHSPRARRDRNRLRPVGSALVRREGGGPGARRPGPRDNPGALAPDGRPTVSRGRRPRAARRRLGAGRACARGGDLSPRGGALALAARRPAPCAPPGGVADGRPERRRLGELDRGVTHLGQTGSVTDFRLPRSFGAAGTVVAGPDGNLWCAARHGNRLHPRRSRPARGFLPAGDPGDLVDHGPQPDAGEAPRRGPSPRRDLRRPAAGSAVEAVAEELGTRLGGLGDVSGGGGYRAPPPPCSASALRTAERVAHVVGRGVAAR